MKPEELKLWKNYPENYPENCPEIRVK